MAGEYYNTQVERLKQLKHFYDDDFYGFYNGNETREFCFEPESARKMFIGGLDPRTTSNSLKTHFEQYGTVVDAVVMKDSKTNLSRGFGFVTYTRSFMVDKAQSACPHKVNGRVVELKRAVPRQKIACYDGSTSVTNIFVSGLQEEHDEADLYNYFRKFGVVRTVNIIIDKESGRKRGFAFVEFTDYDMVDKVVLLKNHTINGTRLEVKKALPKVEMNSQRGGGGDCSGVISGAANQSMIGSGSARFARSNDYKTVGSSYNKWGNNRNGSGDRWFGVGGEIFNQGGGAHINDNKWSGVISMSCGGGGGINTGYNPGNQGYITGVGINCSYVRGGVQDGFGGGIQGGLVKRYDTGLVKRYDSGIGLGYQQDFGGGPIRRNNNSTRMSPYRGNNFNYNFSDNGDGDQSGDFSNDNFENTGFGSMINRSRF